MNPATAPRLLAAAILAVAPAFAVGAAGEGGKSVQSGATRAAVEAALQRRLDRAYLSYQWVFCVGMDRFYHGWRVWRCNVDFGDPHIVQYCVILKGHTLLTDRENHALDCSPLRHAHNVES